MLGSALPFAAVFTGRGSLKNAAYNIGSPSWFGYVSGFIINLRSCPACFLAVWLEAENPASKRSCTGDFRPAPGADPARVKFLIAFTISLRCLNFIM
jgi:hypothetical protein